jgi:hypothetical protein
MPNAEIAVQGLTLTITGCSTPGTAAVTSPPSTKRKEDSHGVYKKQLDISISGCQNGSCVQGAPKTDSIMPTATKNKCEGEFVLRKGDKKQGITINGTNIGTGTACSFPINVEITNAGQTKAKGA